MITAESYLNQQLAHLGSSQACTKRSVLQYSRMPKISAVESWVSMGRATDAMILNGLRWSLRQLFPVPQYFANKPVEHLLGARIRGDMLNDDCPGRSLDWLYAHDPTKVFAGTANRARQVFGTSAHQVPVDTTSFSVSGAYGTGERVQEPGTSVKAREAETEMIPITHDYSRDHREDLKHWMLALATTHDGDVPLFLQPLDSTSLDKVSLLAAVVAVQKQLREADAEPSVYEADNGIYSEANMWQLNMAWSKWVSRVPETSNEAKTILREESQDWQRSEDGSIEWFCRQMELPQGRERWVIVHRAASQQRAQASLQRQVSSAQASWEDKCWHLNARRFACEADARASLGQELKGKLPWVEIHSDVVACPRHAGKESPRKEASPVTSQWQMVVTVTLNQHRVAEEALRKACFIVGTNELQSEALSDQELVTTYKDQGGIERGFRLLKDPLFLVASSFAVLKPERIIALGLIMVLCLQVYRLAGYRLRTHLAETEQTFPDQVGKPTARPTMRWIFHSFEGIELLHVWISSLSRTIVLHLASVHRLILALLGQLYEKLYLSSG